MRTTFLLACSSIGLAAMAAAACASSEEGEGAPPDEGPPAVLSDAAMDDAAIEAGPDGEPELPRCSVAGWCKTSLPDTDLVMKDIWPLRDRAFAVAESPTIGIKVLEWDEATDAWTYIDDESQNEVGYGKYVGAVWAPDDDEVYYAVAPGTIYRGKRPVPPASAWSWTRQRLEDNSHKGEPAHDPTHDHGYPTYSLRKSNYPALGVWGTGSDDVYAWYSNTLFRWKSEDGGSPRWVAEYVADDHETGDEHLFFLSAGGTRGDVWFSGARDRGDSFTSGNSYNCAVAVRRASDSYLRIADGVASTDIVNPCKPRSGFLHVGGPAGWLTDIQPEGTDRVVALKGTRDIARISLEGGSYVVSFSNVPNREPATLYSLWRAPETVWLSGWGIILRGNDLAGDGGIYGVSTISLSGAPLASPMYRIRGTESTNLWAIGERYALHKTTP
jgi:hypothetical protein